MKMIDLKFKQMGTDEDYCVYMELFDYECREAVISEILQLQDSLNSSDKFTAALLWRYELEALEQIKKKGYESKRN
jgi:hypothetical protein